MERQPETSDLTDAEPHAEGLASAPVDFQLLFADSQEVLLVLLPDTPRFTMIAATDARLQATHTTRESLGQGLFELFPDNPDDPAATGTSNLRASLERVLETRQPDTMPVQKYDIRGSNGEFETKHWSPKNLPVLSPAGEVIYILHRVEDVTELVRASELGDQMRGRTHAMEREVIRRSHELDIALQELRATNLKLAELDAAKTVFFSNISHEFRTPLTLILGNLEEELSRAAPVPLAQTRMQLKAAHRSALRLLKLVNSLLEFSRIEAGRMQAHFEPTDLAALTAELAGMFRTAIEAGGLVLRIDCPTLPEPIHVDREMWEKIVLNLLSNAFKHTFKGGITVRLAWLTDGVQLHVEDSGVGISKDDIPRLFDRFHRVEGAASRTHEGTGIGLALVKEFVQLHSGTLKVESEPGRGSRFTVRLKSGMAHLPLERIAGGGAAAAVGRHATPFLQEALYWTAPGRGIKAQQQIATRPEPMAAAVTWAVPRARVLLADDNADMRSYVTRLLRPHYEVLAVADGQAALDAARASPPDLVLSDVMMPVLDGFGLLRALRAEERTRRVPIIFLSARAGEESAVAGLDSGADDYLVKPFCARELLARVRTHVELAWQRRAWELELEKRVDQRTTELEAELKRMSLLGFIVREIAEKQDLRSIFEVVIRAVEDQLPVDRCWIGSAAAAPTAAELERGLVYEPELRGGSLSVPQELSGTELRSMVAVPLRAQDRLLGVLLAGRCRPDDFSRGEQEFLRRLGEHVAIAARQGKLCESLQAAFDALNLTARPVAGENAQREPIQAPTDSEESEVMASMASTR